MTKPEFTFEFTKQKLEEIINEIDKKLKRKRKKGAYKLVFHTVDENNTEQSFATTYMRREDLIEQYKKQLEANKENYNPEYITKADLFLIRDKDPGETVDKGLFGFKKAEDMLNLFLKSRKENKFFADILTNYKIYSPNTRKYCIIKSFVMYDTILKNKDPEKIKQYMETLKRNKVYKTFDLKNLKGYTLRNLGRKLAKHYEFNMEIYDITMRKKISIKLNDEYKTIKLAVYASHCFLLLPAKFKLKKKFKRQVKPLELEKITKNFKFAYFDFETCDVGLKNLKVHVYAAGIAYKQYSTNYYKDFFQSKKYDGNETVLDNFIDFVLNINDNTYLFAHNGGKFDNKLILNHMMNKYPKIMIKSYLDKNGRILSFSFKNNKSKVITIRDSYSLIAQPLSKICKDFNCKYGKLDQSKMTKQHEDVNINNCHKMKKHMELYLKHDVLGLAEAVSKFNGHIEKLFNKKMGIEKCITSASIARKYFRYKLPDLYKKIGTKNKILNLSSYFDDLIRPHYFGGRNECFKLGHINVNLYYYDYTSHYPNEMRNNKFMIGNYYHINYDNLYTKGYKITNKQLIDKHIKDVCLLVCDIKHRISYSELMERKILPLFADKVKIDKCERLVFPYFKDYKEKIITAKEYRYCMKNDIGYDIKIKSAIISDASEHIFTDIIDKLYKLKCDNVDSNPALSKSAKIIINSEYGVWGTKLGVSKTSISTKKQGEKNLHKFIASGNLEDYFVMGDSMITKYKTTINSECMNVLIAHCITSYARLTLYKDMMLARKNDATLYYCDTDSFIVDKCLENTNKYTDFKGKFQTGSLPKLGELTNETKVKKGYYDEGVFLGCKFYALKGHNVKDELKGKGIPMYNTYKYKHTNNDEINYSDLSYYGKHKIAYKDFISMSFGKTLSINQLSFRGNLKNDLYKEIRQKIFKMEYYKGKVKNGDIYPLKL